MRQILLVLILLVSSAAPAGEPYPSAESLDAATKRYIVSSEKPYDDVLEDLEFSISQHNYRITGRNQIGNAIAQSENIDFQKSTIVHFCNLQAAKEIYDINPDFLLHMPCRMTLREVQGSVIIEARLVPENDPALKQISLRINAMMRSIADYAAE
ncbi:MAG: DUF302 domain-containing protein [Gammaproteobacteria bacterium]|nr:DUF302 domain-containing protein [Gammaproteobacteria bacterium]